MHAKTQIRRTMTLMPRAGTPNQSWRDVLDEVREIASRTGTGRTKLLRKLDELDLAMSGAIDTLDHARRRRIVGPRARVRAATYTVEESRRGPALVEMRPDASARPYKVPLPHYRAVAAAVAATREPQLFATIKSAASRGLSEELPDYAARVSLRLWSAAALVQHEGARFTRVGNKAEFTRATRETWARLEHEPLEVGAAQA